MRVVGDAGVAQGAEQRGVVVADEAFLLRIGDRDALAEVAIRA